MEPTPLLDVVDQTVDLVTGDQTIQPVRSVSFQLRRGETFGIVGESGSGKSMLAKSLMHILPDNARVAAGSSVRYDGRRVDELPSREARHFWGTKMAMVFQDPMTTLNPVRTIGAQMTDPLRYHLKLSRSAARERAADLLARVGLSEPKRRLGQHPHELSGGMRQRVVIAMALSCDPELVIADEPTTALDVTVQRQILDLLADLRAERDLAMVLISHDLGLVSRHTDRVAVMYAGRFVEHAASAAVFAGEGHPYTAALLDSMPRFDAPSHTRLRSIEGRPPDLRALPAGCSFAPRCRYADDRCRQERPRLLPVGPGHDVACHRTEEAAAGAGTVLALGRDDPHELSIEQEVG
ncbi:MAG TPA: ABC transporter ATP-binding protein [Acidimicrobiales bacterium]|nr:ABC transporter ATP-binding protein [Acidimicrobiales bacterium]